MRIILSGQKYLGVRVLDGLRQRHTIAFVSAPNNTDKLATHAHDLGIRVRLWSRWHSDPDVTADLIVCAHSWEFVPSRVTARVAPGIGAHPSLLPLYRGKYAIEEALMAGERVTGVSIYALTDQLDQGDIYAQEHCFIWPDDTARALWQRSLQPMAERLLIDTVDAIARGDATKTPQDVLLPA